MWYDRDIDAVMRRTRNRPIPAGRIEPGAALAYGVTLAVGSVIVMCLAVNIAAAVVLALSIAFYVFVYTVWLKRRTPQNIVIGGAAGAFPAVVGWAAVTGSVDLVPLVLFSIVFFWTPPHFWSLALFANDDYRRAGVPMLPVVAGAKETRRQIVIYTLLLVPLSLAPWCDRLQRPGLRHRRVGAGRRLPGLRAARAARPAGCGGRQPDRRCAGARRVPLLDRCICSCCSPRSRWTGWSGDAGAAWNRIRRVPRRSEAEEMRRRRRGRNIALIVVLVALAVLFYAITIVKLRQQGPF